MPSVEFLPLDPRTINVRTFDCGKEAINVYLRRYAAKNMALNLNRTFVLPYSTEDRSEKAQVAAYYTLAHQTLVREELPDPSRLPRYPVPIVVWEKRYFSRMRAIWFLTSTCSAHSSGESITRCAV